MSLIKAINQLNYTFTHRSTSRSLGGSRVTTASVDAKAKWTAASETSVFWGVKSNEALWANFSQIEHEHIRRNASSVVKCRAFRLEWQAAILVSLSYLLILSQPHSHTHKHRHAKCSEGHSGGAGKTHSHLNTRFVCACVSAWLRHCVWRGPMADALRQAALCHYQEVIRWEDSVTSHRLIATARKGTERGRVRGGREGGREGVRKIVWEWINTFNSSSLLRLHKSRQARRKREGDWDTV